VNSYPKRATYFVPSCFFVQANRPHHITKKKTMTTDSTAMNRWIADRQTS
jgi:hypothetical protein